MKLNALALIVASCLVGCASTTETSASSNHALVGGTVETGYPAVGHLVIQLTEGTHAGQQIRTFCAATLISPTAVLTAGSCVSDKIMPGTKVVGIGFGDPQNGPLYEVSGTPDDWIPTGAIEAFTTPDGETFYSFDPHYDVAVVKLARPVRDIEPMRTTTSRVPVGTLATTIAYGRVLPSTSLDEAWEPLDAILAETNAYPGIRKSALLEVGISRGSIEAFPAAGSDTAVCLQDNGAPLILADGTLAGVLGFLSSEDVTAVQFDGVPWCRPGGGGQFTNLRFGRIPAFVADKLAAGGAR